jgi:hypothetical protein
VSLAAVAVARRAVLHATAGALEAAARLPLHTLSCVPLRGPVLSASVSLLSGAAVGLDLMELGLPPADPRPTATPVSSQPSTPTRAAATAAAAKDNSPRRGLGTLHEAGPATQPSQTGLFTADESAAWDATLAWYAHNSLGADTDTWSPLALALSHGRMPVTPSRLRSIWGGGCATLSEAEESEPVAYGGEGVSAAGAAAPTT